MRGELLRTPEAGVKIALTAAHFRSVGVVLAGSWDTAEKAAAGAIGGPKRYPKCSKNGTLGALKGAKEGHERVF
jgi:hypothetical protein